MRKFIYFVIGVASSAIILISMVVNAPKVDIVKTSVADFYTPKKDESQDIGEVTGENSSFLEFGSYHLTGVDYDYYNDRNIVDFGKPNPAFFYKEVVKKKETAQNIENGNSSEKDSTKTDSTAAGESTKDSSDNISSNNEETQGAAAPSGGAYDEEDFLANGYVMEGYNVISGKKEEVDISAPLKDFKENAVLPVDSEYYGFTSSYGERVDPLENKEAFHTGLDIAKEGINEKNVYSVSKGEVLLTSEGDSGYGNYVILKHDGYNTLYGHLSSIENLKKGDKVSPGTIIGKVGSTGRSTGPHLHFEVRVGTVTLDPMPFVSKIKK